MKVTELMIGDWVSWKTKQVQIVRLSGIRYSFNHYDVVLAYCNKVRDGLECHDISSISPIPLTPEVLEKNRFKEVTKRVKSLIWRLKEEDIIVEVIEITPNVFQITKHQDLSDLSDERVNVRYVHELQHALRLCRLNELADNFKV